MIGDDGIITNSQIASIESKFAGYKEELEENIVSKEEGNKERINLLNKNVKTYIPSLEENDVGRFAVIEGELYYLGDDELSKKAAQNQKMEVMDSGAETESNVASRIEEKAIESMVKSRGKDAFKYTDEKGEKQLGGIKLVEKNFDNSTSWKIVTETGEDGKIRRIYDKGYYYIKKGITIDGIGKTDYGYIVDYDSNDVIQYKESTHKYFSYEDSVAVTDNLLFNADPGVIDSYFSDKENFKKDDLGKGIEFYGYGNGDEPDFEQAFTPTSFKFDGENDYITIDCDTAIARENIKEKGLTFEFYGKLFDDGKGFNDKGEDFTCSDGFSGMFCYWNGNEKSQGKARFGFTRPNHCLAWSFLVDWDIRNDLENYCGPNTMETTSPWCQITDDNSVKTNMDIFLTIIINPSCKEVKSGETLDGTKFEENLCISQKVYIDDEESLDGWMSQNIWNKFCEKCLPNLKKFCLGRCSMSGDGNWLYTHMDCYSLRFYSRALTDDEVHKNYEKTKEYHKILESQNNK